MYDTILHPTDGSTGTAHVTLQAIDLAKQYDATIHAVHVIDSDVTSLLTDAGKDKNQLEQRGEMAVESVERLASEHGVTVETTVFDGSPSSKILNHAEEIDADIIVAGTHGRSGVKRQVLGSVAERLVRHAEMPVMTVRLPETDETVADADHAADIASESLDDAGYDADVQNVSRQKTVWVVDADSENGELLVYVDPKTQRTSIIG